MTPIAHCPACAASLAHDQRYCLECGERRDPLPREVTAMIAGAVEAARDASAVAETPAPDHEEAASDWRTMPAPRAAAVAVMALLAFGVLLGSVVSPAEESSANSPIIVSMQTPAPAPPPAAAEPDTTPAPADTSADTSAPADSAPADSAPSSAPPPSNDQPSAPAPPPEPDQPAVNHLFVVMLSGQGFNQTYGPNTTSTYLAKDLRKEGELLDNYYAVTAGSLANQIALISGQGPTQETAANCPNYADVTPGTVNSDNQVVGSGCIYPKPTLTLGDQLTAAGKTWKAYVEDMGNGPAPEAKTCRHPAVGSADTEQAPRPGDTYVTWRNPFVYFHSQIDVPACNDVDVGLDQLAPDLKDATKTPTLSYIVPNRCHDGSDDPCAPGVPAGLPAADAWLRQVIPEIEGSAAYKDGGMIAITFDQAPQTGPNADPSACCEPPQYPNVAPPAGATGPTGPTGTTTPVTGGSVVPTGGGGKLGLLLISDFVKPGSENTLGYYNHFSLLRSIENLFQVDPLGYAAQPTLPSFDKTVYNGDLTPTD